ncbi:MAG: hypothetical protein AAF394_07235, partial [Planctomycetota bacterium]
MLVGGLETLAETLDSVEQHAEYAKQIPGLESGAGQVADLSELVQDGLIEPLSTLLDSSSSIATQELLGLLDGYHNSSNGVVTSIEADSVAVT